MARRFASRPVGVNVPKERLQGKLLAWFNRRRYNRLVRSKLILSCLFQTSLTLIGQSLLLQSIAPDAATGTSQAVIVDAEGPLVHTCQVFPLNQRKQTGAQAADKQAEQVLANLGKILGEAGSDLQKVAKLNIYLAQAETLSMVQKVLAQRFSGAHKPAASFVVTALPVAGALVGMDAVAASPEGGARGEPKSFTAPEINGQPGMSAAAILPPGRRMYVSGMADTNNLPEATKRTLDKLTAAIGHLGVQKSDVVQLKAFLQPMSQAATVQKAIVDFFGGKAPPTVFVEWISPAPNPPIEIELIAAGKSATNESETVTFLTPPGTTSTKVFSRVAQVNRGKLIYISGLYSARAEDAGGEVREIFESLGQILKTSGSDFEHLVKATYYVSDDLAGDKLNEIRPEFYNPLRPPAASKAKVRGVAEQGKSVSVDMIAVTK